MPREHERVPYLTEILLDFESGRHEARISDLSEGGCYVDCWAGVQPGDTLQFEIVLPDGGRLPVIGEVAYAFEGLGFGVKFAEMGETERGALRELVAAEAVA